MGKNRLWKRILVYLMTFMMVFSSLPTSVFAAGEKGAKTNEAQIGPHYEVDASGNLPDTPGLEGDTSHHYGVNESEGKAEEGESYDDVVVDKTISATGEENKFKINLKVTTKQKIEEPDMAVAFVVDVSTSMDAYYNANKSQTRIQAAQEAMKQFVEEFGDVASGTTKREIAITKFCVDAETVTEWVDVTTKAGRQTVYDYIDTLHYGVGENSDSTAKNGGTNIEGGLLLGRNLVAKQSIEDKHVILLSDGGANSCVLDTDEKGFKAHDVEKPVYYSKEELLARDSFEGSWYYADYHFYHDGAKKAADSIQTMDVELHTVYCGNTNDKLTVGDTAAKGLLSGGNACDYCKAANAAFAANNDSLDYLVTKFLAEISDDFVATTNSEDLLGNILKLAREIGEAWVVTDPIPMGNHIEFINFEKAGSSYVYDSSLGAISWDLKSVASNDIESTTVDGVTTYTYTVSYYVRLDNVYKDFKEGISHNTNNKTSVPYVISRTTIAGNEENVVTYAGTAYFNVPSVTGYTAELTFEKAKYGQVAEGSKETEPLAGAEFAIRHDASCGCGITLDDPNWEMTTKTNSNGDIKFTDIPSGHTYIMTEKSAPNTYQVSDGEYKFSVALGTVSEISNTLFDNNKQIVNEKIRTTTIKGTKTWEGGNSNSRPNVTINLYANGVPALDANGNDIKVTLSSSTGWGYEFTNLPIADENGNLIEYTIIESPVDNYYPSYEGYNVKNIYSTNKNITVQKLWDDANDQDGIRPGSISVQLIQTKSHNQESSNYGESVTLSESNGWSHAFENLPKEYTYRQYGWNRTGQYSYSVKELTATQGYEKPVITANGSIGYIITNKHTPATTSISGVKTWDDNDDAYGARPDSVTVNLTGKVEGTTVINKTTTASAAGNWEWTFSNLPVKNAGENIIYTVDEVAVPGYTTVVNDNQTEITNRINEEILEPVHDSVTVNKHDQTGKPLNGAEFGLYDNEKCEGNAVNTFSGGEFTIDTENEALASYLPTTDNGTATLYLKETKAPTGYDKSDNVYPVVITTDITTALDEKQDKFITTTTYTIMIDGKDAAEIKNTKKTGVATAHDSVTVSKVDQDDAALDGAEFGLYDNKNGTGNVIKEYEGGTFEIDTEELTSVLPEAGKTKTLYLIETQAPAGYEADTTVREVVISAAEEENLTNGVFVTTTTYTVKIDGADSASIENTKKTRTDTAHDSVTVNKKDQADAALDGAEFGLYDNKNGTGNAIKEYEGGTFEIDTEELTSVLPEAGKTKTLYLIETQAPAGYEADTTAREVVISAAEEENLTNGVFVTTTTYTITINGEESVDVVNTAITSVSVNKQWDGGTDRPSVQVQLLANGKAEGNPVTLNENNNWSYEWEGLDKFDSNNEEIKYTVEEVSVPDGYVVQISGTNGEFTITNVEKTQSTITKIWNDANDREEERPNELTVTLTATVGNEVKTVKTVELTPDMNWTYTEENLPKYENGVEIQYAWTEDFSDLPDKYGMTGYETTQNGNVITNTYPIKTTSISGQKTWEGDGSDLSLRPEKITIQLLQNGTVVATTEATKNNNWSYTFNNLAEYDADGKDYIYTIDEAVIPGYSETITGNDIKNTLNLKVEDDQHDKVTITKTDGKELLRGATFKLFDGNAVVRTYEGGEFEISTSDNDLADLLPAPGESKELTLKETAAPAGYSPSEEAFDVVISTTLDYELDKDTNTYKKTTIYTIAVEEDKTLSVPNEKKTGEAAVYNPVTVTKTDKDDGKTLSGAEFTLYSDNDCAEEDSIKAYESNNEGIIVISPEDLDETALPEAGNTAKFYLKETKAPVDYQLKETIYEVVIDAVEGDPEYNEEEDKFITTTTYTAKINGKTAATIENGLVLTEATILKVWDDADNQDGKRPTELTVTLSNGKSVTLNEANKWIATIKDLPKYKNGVEIEYSWTEASVDGYKLTDTSAEGTVTTLTNTHTPEETEATVTKVWDDADNQDGKRPAELTVTLSNGTEVTLNEANGWTATVENLPKYKDAGKEIVYTWTEGEMSEGYELTATSSEGTVTTLTNSYEPEVREATVTKIWDDSDNQDGKRPENLTVTLSNGTEDVKTVTLSEENQWSATVENLPVYKAGEKIVYTWTEADVEEYELTGTAENGTITLLTNSHVPETTELTVYKSWKDKHDKYDTRPEEITVYLEADGEIVQTVQITEADKWRYTFSELPKYADGEEIVYTISEEPVDGYITDIEDMTITNTINPDELDDFADTGDDSKPWAYGFAAMMAMLTAAGTLFFRRKED